jgi:hypothetical protein
MDRLDFNNGRYAGQAGKLHSVWHLGVESQMPWLVVEDDLPRVRCDESPSLVEAWANAKREEESASL